VQSAHFQFGLGINSKQNCFVDKENRLIRLITNLSATDDDILSKVIKGRSVAKGNYESDLYPANDWNKIQCQLQEEQ
jgi:hypothetical protein